MIELPWITEARKHIGQREIPGRDNNPLIVQFFKDIDSAWFNNDEIAWCAAFLGHCLKVAGLPTTRSARALSYQNYGARLHAPVYGCIATKERRNASGVVVGGHVTFVIGRTPYGALLCLGGNQGDAVSIATYPEKAFNAFRMPPGLWEQQELPVIQAAAGNVKEA